MGSLNSCILTDLVFRKLKIALRDRHPQFWVKYVDEHFIRVCPDNELTMEEKSSHKLPF